MGLVFIIFFILGIIISWLITAGIVKLITLCFGLTFSWAVATGIWLVLCLLSAFLKGKS